MYLFMKYADRIFITSFRSRLAEHWIMWEQSGCADYFLFSVVGLLRRKIAAAEGGTIESEIYVKSIAHYTDQILKRWKREEQRHSEELLLCSNKTNSIDTRNNNKHKYTDIKHS